MVNLPYKSSKLLLTKILIIKIILKIKVIVIIIKIVKCRDRYRMPKTTNTELLVTLQNDQKPLSNIKKSSPSNAVRSIYASEMTYSSLSVMNRGRPCHLNSLLGTLPHLIFQE